MAEPAVRRGYVDHKEGQLHYRIAQGRANYPPLLLLHPTPKTGWIFEKFMRRLAAGGRTVVAPDTPGYGASDQCSKRPVISDYAEANFVLVDALVAKGEIAGGPFDVGGYHTGSVTGCEMAISAPTPIRRVIFFSLPLYDIDQRTEKLRKLSNWPKPEGDGGHLKQMWDLVGSLCDDRVQPEWQHRSVTENLRAFDNAAGYGAVYSYDLFAALPEVRQPVLLINAGDDLHGQTRRALPLIPDADYHELPRLAHGMFDLDIECLAELAERFLNRI